MKKIILSFSVLILLFLITCEKKTTVRGMVGQKLHLAPTVMSQADTAGCFFRWEFEKKPAGSRLDILAFEPSNRKYNIYFVPDVAGEYIVECLLIESNGDVRASQKFYCNVKEDTLEGEKVPAEEKDTAGITPEYGEVEDTSEMVSEKTAVAEKEKGKIRETEKLDVPAKAGAKYTIQLIARKTYAKAKKDMEKLESHNLDVYLQKKHFEKTGETWYRVRTGTFDDYEEAKQNAHDLARKFKKYGYYHLWVDYLRK